MVAELHRMGDVTDANVTLRGGNDFARLYTAAALDQFAIEPGLLEISVPVGHELRLIDRDSHRVDHAPRCVRRDGATARNRNAATCNYGQCRTSGNVGHQARSLSLATTFSSALRIASPIFSS